MNTDKSKILKDNKNKSGIYLIRNMINGKKYVGSSENLSHRLSFYITPSKMNYVLKRGKSAIYSAIIKYGQDNFSIEIIEYCEPGKCLEREKYYIDLLRPEYNIINDPTIPPMSGRKHSNESKQKMSDIAKEINHSGRFMTCHKKIEGSGKLSQKIEVFDNENKETTSYDSIHEAARALNLPRHNTISNYIQRNQQKPYKGRYTFKKK
jgi:hypothetical protein